MRKFCRALYFSCVYSIGCYIFPSVRNRLRGRVSAFEKILFLKPSLQLWLPLLVFSPTTFSLTTCRKVKVRAMACGWKHPQGENLTNMWKFCRNFCIVWCFFRNRLYFTCRTYRIVPEFAVWLSGTSLSVTSTSRQKNQPCVSKPTLPQFCRSGALCHCGSRGWHWLPLLVFSPTTFSLTTCRKVKVRAMACGWKHPQGEKWIPTVEPCSNVS